MKKDQEEKERQLHAVYVFPNHVPISSRAYAAVMPRNPLLRPTFPPTSIPSSKHFQKSYVPSRFSSQVPTSTTSVSTSTYSPTFIESSVKSYIPSSLSSQVPTSLSTSTSKPSFIENSQKSYMPSRLSSQVFIPSVTINSSPQETLMPSLNDMSPMEELNPSFSTKNQTFAPNLDDNLFLNLTNSSSKIITEPPSKLLMFTPTSNPTRRSLSPTRISLDTQTGIPSMNPSIISVVLTEQESDYSLSTDGSNVEEDVLKKNIGMRAGITATCCALVVVLLVGVLILLSKKKNHSILRVEKRNQEQEEIIPTNILESVPTLELIEITMASSGKLGIVISTIQGVPTIHEIKQSSPLKNELKVGDTIVAVDGIDVRSYNATKLSKLLLPRKNNNQHTRKLTIVRTIE